MFRGPASFDSRVRVGAGELHPAADLPPGICLQLKLGSDPGGGTDDEAKAATEEPRDVHEADAGAVMLDGPRPCVASPICRARPMTLERPGMAGLRCRRESVCYRPRKRTASSRDYWRARYSTMQVLKDLLADARRPARSGRALQDLLKMSERRACSMVGAASKSVRYRNRRGEDTDPRQRLRERFQPRTLTGPASGSACQYWPR